MVDIQSYPWATAKKSDWTLKVGEQDWEQLAFSLSNFLSHIVFFGLSTPLFLFASPFSLFLLLAFPFSSFQHAASLNPFLPLFSLFSSLSFSLLVSKLQMSNPSTPPQTVQGFVYKCSLLHVCKFASAGKKVWKKKVCMRLCACMSPWAPFTFGMLLPLAPHYESSMNDKIWGVMVEGTAAAKPTQILPGDTLPESMQISRPTLSSHVWWQSVGTVIHERVAKLNFKITVLPFNLPYYPQGIAACCRVRKQGKGVVGGRKCSVKEW